MRLSESLEPPWLIVGHARRSHARLRQRAFGGGVDELAGKAVDQFAALRVRLKWLALA